MIVTHVLDACKTAISSRTCVPEMFKTQAAGAAGPQPFLEQKEQPAALCRVEPAKCSNVL